MIAVESADFHDGFTPAARGDAAVGQWNDIAILHLATPVSDHAVQKLASKADVSMSAGTLLMVAGYGLTDQAEPSSAGTLMEGQSALGAVGAFEIGTGSNGPQYACHGDSGGPLLAGGDVQVGIASHMGWITDGTTTTSSCKFGMYYTRVDAYGDWIAKRVGDDQDDDGGGSSGATPPSAATLLVLLAMLRRRR